MEYIGLLLALVVGYVLLHLLNNFLGKKNINFLMITPIALFLLTVYFWYLTYQTRGQLAVVAYIIFSLAITILFIEALVSALIIYAKIKKENRE